MCVDNIPRVGNVSEVSKGVWNNDGFGKYETSKQTVDLTQKIGAIGPKCFIDSAPSTPASVETSLCPKNCIDLCLWNVNGLTQDKLHDHILGKYFSQFDIIILLETWSDGEGNYELYDYKYFDFKREYRHAKAKRASGGIGVYIRFDVCHAVEIFRNSGDTVVWLKFKKEYLQISVDLYLGAVYFSPENSTCTIQDPFSVLQNDITQLPNHSMGIICGDFNARTNVNPDYEWRNSEGSDGDLVNFLPADILYGEKNTTTFLQENGILHRHSMDKSKPNDYGIQLLDLCKSANLMILNGRVGSDKGVGDYTRTDTTGNSVVDYVITTIDAYPLINKFKIHSKLPESDHRPIEFALKCNSDTSKSGGNIHEEERGAMCEWVDQYKYIWNYQDLSTLDYILNDEMSKHFHAKFIDEIISCSNPNKVARSFEEYLAQACQRVFKMQRVKPHRPKGPLWFDSDCKRARYDAVQAGARGGQESLDKCKNYRSLKQRKKRLFQQSCIDKIEHIYNSNRSDMWATISSFAPKTQPLNIPSGVAFLDHYKKLAQPDKLIDFDYEHESFVKASLRAYDTTISHNRSDDGKNDILNTNFSPEEIQEAVGKLKVNKSVGTDCIPAEFIKACNGSFIQNICYVLNYCIELRQFPDTWAEGLRTSVYKTGDKLNPDNYRGITVLPIFEKIFEIVVQQRLEFINEAFDRTDKYNGGFLKGSRTSDNIYILQSLIERQINLGQSLIVCFVDFSKAFDLINRDILFYKIIKSGLHGRVIDTLRDLYSKTAFRIKHNGSLSPPVLQTVGVNQGGNASPSIFREYMSDLRDYLDECTGVCLSDITISDTILLNLLWADDLIMVSTTPSGAQKQLNGLELFSRKNQTTVNNLKTKVMIFGRQLDVNLTYKGNIIEQVGHYKYLGNTIRSIQRYGDIFANNYEYLCDKARKATFGLLSRLRHVGPLPPQTMIYLFESCVQPILTYGSDVWGANKAGRDAVDKILLYFLRLVLHVKPSTSNVITLGECGKIPPGVFCETNCILFFLRLRSLSDRQ